MILLDISYTLSHNSEHVLGIDIRSSTETLRFYSISYALFFTIYFELLDIADI